MENSFYYYLQSNKYGPYDIGQISILVQRGVITPTTKLEDLRGRQGMARQIPGLFQNNFQPIPNQFNNNPQQVPRPFNNNPQLVPNQFNNNQEQYHGKNEDWIGISLGVSVTASILSFIIAMFGINAIQKSIFYAQNSKPYRDISVLDAAWKYHSCFNVWAVIGSIIAALVVFGLAYLITFQIVKNMS